MDGTLIALAPKEFSKIEVQTIILEKEGKTYVNSVNIIVDGIIIEKIKQQDYIETISFNAEELALNYVKNKLKPLKGTTKKRTKYDKKKAGNTIMNEFYL